MTKPTCNCELDGFQGATTSQNCLVHDTNSLLDQHFEEQRIHDLKIDIDAVLEEVERMHKKNPDNRLEVLYKDLNWFKTLL